MLAFSLGQCAGLRSSSSFLFCSGCSIPSLCLIGDWLEHSIDIADEHSRVTNDVLLHEVDGVVNLARSAQHLNDGVMLVLVSE